MIKLDAAKKRASLTIPIYFYQGELLVTGGWDINTDSQGEKQKSLLSIPLLHIYYNGTIKLNSDLYKNLKSYRIMRIMPPRGGRMPIGFSCLLIA